MSKTGKYNPITTDIQQTSVSQKSVQNHWHVENVDRQQLQVHFTDVLQDCKSVSATSLHGILSVLCFIQCYANTIWNAAHYNSLYLSLRLSQNWLS